MMKDTPGAKTLQEVEGLEERLQAVKWTIVIRAPRVSIVSQTAGVLGRRFLSGRLYEQRLRRTWKR